MQLHTHIPVRFRWLQCQLDLLCKIKTNKGIREALSRLPQGLFETYDRILENIDPNCEELAQKAILWIAASARPMQLDELVEAIAVNEGEPTLDLDSTVNDGRDLLGICGSLFECDRFKSTSIVSLSHYSVKVCS